MKNTKKGKIKLESVLSKEYIENKSVARLTVGDMGILLGF